MKWATQAYVWVPPSKKVPKWPVTTFFRCNLLSLGAFKIARSHSSKDKIRLRKEKQVGYTLNYIFGKLSSVSADRALSLWINMTFSHIRKLIVCAVGTTGNGPDSEVQSFWVGLWPHQSHATSPVSQNLLLSLDMVPGLKPNDAATLDAGTPASSCMGLILQGQTWHLSTSFAFWWILTPNHFLKIMFRWTF